MNFMPASLGIQQMRPVGSIPLLGSLLFLSALTLLVGNRKDIQCVKTSFVISPPMFPFGTIGGREFKGQLAVAGLLEKWPFSQCVCSISISVII